MPRFTFITIAYNAANTLPDLFYDLLSQDFPHKQVEVLLVNSNSTDSTLKVMKKFKSNNDFADCKILQNDKKILAAGWNVALKNAKGDIIVKIDSHARIEPDFLSNVDKNMTDGEYIVGGQRPTIFDGTTYFQRMLAHAEASVFGSGIAVYRRSVSKQYVSTLAHAAYRKEVFETVGGYNENLVRTEDNEIHYRMRKAGFKFCLCPDIISYQHARSSVKSMLKQKWGNGYWIGLTMGVCPKCFSLYNFVPLGFTLALILSLVLCVFFKNLLLPALLLILYFAGAVGFTLLSMAGEKSKRVKALMVLMPFIFFLMHISYGFGTLVGLIKMPFWRIKNNGNKN